MTPIQTSRVTVAEHIVQLEARLKRALAERAASRASGPPEQVREAEVRVDLLATQLDLRRRQRLP